MNTFFLNVFNFFTDPAAITWLLGLSVGITGIHSALNKKILPSLRVDRAFKAMENMPVVLPKPLSLEYQKDINEKFDNEMLAPFLEVINANFSDVNKNLINRNLESLKIHKSYNLIASKLLGFSSAAYECKKNYIVMNYKSLGLNHELLHAASTHYDNKEVHTGFMYKTDELKRSEIGRGFNEGFTSLLDCKYFRKDKDDLDLYCIERNAAYITSYVVGKEKMEQMYFEGNSKGLIEELKKYDSEENIVNFLRNLDALNFIVRDRKKVVRDDIDASLKIVTSTLERWITLKTQELQKKGVLSELGGIVVTDELGTIMDNIKNIENKLPNSIKKG